jgi:putative peptidoglycan lipid II flippase
MTRFFNSFSLFLIFISLLLFFFIPSIIDFAFPIYKGEEKELLIFLSRLFLLSPVFMGISNFFITINQRNKIFLPMALTGLFYNLAMIFGIIFLSPIFGIKGLAYSVIFGAILYLLIQLPTIIKFHLFKYKIKFLKKEEIKDLLKITLPRSIALSISSMVVIYFYSKISDLNQEGLIVIFTFAYAIF